MIELNKPETWLESDVIELYSFVETVSSNLNKSQQLAQSLQETYKTKNAHKAILKDFDHANFSDLQKVLHGRLVKEKPDLDLIFGKVPDKAAGAFTRTVQKRIEFASKYKYGKDVVSKETDRFK